LVVAEAAGAAVGAEVPAVDPRLKPPVERAARDGVEVVGADGPVTFMKARSGTCATLAGDRHCLVNGQAGFAASAPGQIINAL
jgi:hypothetical protein